MVLGILAFVACLGPLAGIPAIICGHVACAGTRRIPNLQGRGMAIAGLIMGYFVLVLTALGGWFFWYFAEKVGEAEALAETQRIESLERVEPSDAECLVILPDGHNPKEPIPVAIWLHGYGSSPSELSFFEEDYQQRADELKIAFVGISGTARIEDGGYEWTEDFAIDHEYVDEVLSENAGKVVPDWPRVALFGFSQGAKVAGDLALNFPDRYAGAILLSPGGHREEPAEPESPSPDHANQRYICIVGAGEAFGNRQLTREYKNAAEELGASVLHKEYPGMDDHTTPPDYEEKLSEWLGSILGIR